MCALSSAEDGFEEPEEDFATRVRGFLFSDDATATWARQVWQGFVDTATWPPDVHARLCRFLNDEPDLHPLVAAYQEDLEEFFIAVFAPGDDDSDDEDDGWGFGESPSGPGTPTETEVVGSFTTRSVMGQRASSIEQVSSTLDVSADLALLLLRKFRWDVNASILGFGDHSAEILRSFAIPESKLREPLVLAVIEEDFCDICMEGPVPLLQLYCGHSFCGECWSGHAIACVRKKSHCVSCQSFECPAIVSESDVRQLVDPEDLPGLERLLRDEVILTDPSLVACPGVDCDRILGTSDIGLYGVAACDCAFEICWRCKEEVHLPLSCEQKESWAQRGSWISKMWRKQRIWSAREERLMQYRREHLAELKACYRQELDDLRAESARKSQEDTERITQLAQRCSPDIVARQRRRADMDQQERAKAIMNRKMMQQYSIRGLQDPSHIEYFMREMRDKEELIMLNMGAGSSESYVEKLTKKCPKCGVLSGKEDGCNVVRCGQCQCEYCWNCGKPWATHSDHFGCTEFSGGKLKVFDDGAEIPEAELNLDDPTYYPPPMTFEIRQECLKLQHFQNLHDVHQTNKKFDRSNRKEIGAVMAKAFLHSTTPVKAQALVDEVFRVLDHARNVLMWSYPAALLAEDSGRRAVIEACLGAFEMRMDELARLVYHYNFQSYGVVETAASHLGRFVDSFLKDLFEAKPSS